MVLYTTLKLLKLIKTYKKLYRHIKKIKLMLINLIYYEFTIFHNKKQGYFFFSLSLSSTSSRSVLFLGSSFDVLSETVLDLAPSV